MPRQRSPRAGSQTRLFVPLNLLPRSCRAQSAGLPGGPVPGDVRPEGHACAPSPGMAGHCGRWGALGLKNVRAHCGWGSFRPLAAVSFSSVFRGTQPHCTPCWQGPGSKREAGRPVLQANPSACLCCSTGAFLLLPTDAVTWSCAELQRIFVSGSVSSQNYISK